MGLPHMDEEVHKMSVSLSVDLVIHSLVDGNGEATIHIMVDGDGEVILLTVDGIETLIYNIDIS